MVLMLSGFFVLSLEVRGCHSHEQTVFAEVIGLLVFFKLKKDC